MPKHVIVELTEDGAVCLWGPYKRKVAEEVAEQVRMHSGWESSVEVVKPELYKKFTPEFPIPEPREEDALQERVEILEARIAGALAEMDACTYGDPEVGFNMRAHLDPERLWGQFGAVPKTEVVA